MPGTEHFDQYAPSRKLVHEQIPNIDLGTLFTDKQELRDQLSEQLRQACLESGFFYVHNTCVDDRTIESALAATEVFFDLPDAGPVKHAVHNRHAGGKKGWGPMFGEPAYQKGTIAQLKDSRPVITDD